MVIRFTVLIVALLLPASGLAQDAPGTVKYPAAQDSADSLIRAADNAAGRLKDSISAAATTLTLSGGGDAFPASGILTIDGREVLTYTSRVGNVFSGLTRGQFGTTALTFAAGVAVELRIMAAYHNTLSLAVRNLEAKVGAGASTPQSGYLPFGTGAGASAWRAMAAGDITAALGYTPANATGLVSATRSVSGTSPVRINGGASGTLAADLTISCLTASGSQTGCLSASDWMAFNGKQPAGNYLVDPSAGGLLARTSLNTVTPRQIAVGANLSVSNADGAGGNPTISLGGNVVTNMVNDTNITGAISSNALTLGWSGQLSKSRQNGATVYTDQANTFGNFVQTFQAGANFLLADPTDTSKKFKFDGSNITTATTRTVNIPNANSTTVQASSAGANQFATAISAQGVVTYTQPSFANLSGTATSGQLPSSVVYNNQANTYTAGNKQAFGPNATSAGLNVGSNAGDPSSLANGDVWYDSTGNALKARINGSTVSLGAGGGISAIGTIDSQTKSANGLVISGTSIYAQTADASSPGLVSTSTQTIAGNKTLTGITSHGSGTNYNEGGQASQGATALALLAASGSSGSPVNSNLPTISIQRQDATTNGTPISLIPYQFSFQKQSGNGDVYAIHSFVRQQSGSARDTVAVTGSVYASPSITPTASQTNYGLWGRAERAVTGTRIVGSELDAVNSTDTDCLTADNTFDSCIGLAIVGTGFAVGGGAPTTTAHNSVGLVFQTGNGATGKGGFFTGIQFNSGTFFNYGIDLKPNGTNGVPIRFANATYAAWRNATDTTDIQAFGVDGSNTTRIRGDAATSAIKFSNTNNTVDYIQIDANPVAMTVNGRVTANNVVYGRTNLGLSNGLNSDINIGTSSYVRVGGPTAAYSLGGFQNGVDGRIMVVFNSVAQTVTVINQDPSSIAANRIVTMTGANVTLRATAQSCATFIYSGLDSRWILLSTN